MKKELIPVVLLSALLIFLVWLFETRFFTGQISPDLYITLIALVFLFAGLFFGLRFRKKRSDGKMEGRLPEIAGMPNALLTERETEIMAWIAAGHSNREISEKAFISENTVKKHLTNIYAKLDVKRRTQAVSRARKLGIIGPAQGKTTRK